MKKSKRQIGKVAKTVIEKLGLHNIFENQPIFLGEQNESHMKKRHPYEYDIYFGDIELIISEPDYVGSNPRDKSIMYVKLYKIRGDYIRVGVKISAQGTLYARTPHSLSTCNAEKYIKSGTLVSISYDKKHK